MQDTTLKLIIDAVDKTGSAFTSVGRKMKTIESSLKDTGQRMQDLGSTITRYAMPAFIALTGTGIAVSKMAWDQVSSVEQATIAFRAYEKNGTKVDNVLKGLLEYARSDLGVLFNRKDLFAAAQGLKIMGAETENLTDYVKTMSRSVGLGMSTWEDLTRIIGRIGSTGRLAGEDFDNLTKAGFKLDKSLRNTNITWEELFKALDKGIPATAMAGQANTIVGLGVRLQTAFRGIGEAILGVDKDTSQFVKGGAGDRLKNFIGDLAEALKGKEIQEGFKKLGQSFATFLEKLLPKIIDFVKFVAKNSDAIIKITGALVLFGGGLDVFGKALDVLSLLVNPMNLLLLAFAGMAAIFVKGFIDDCGGVGEAFKKVKEVGLDKAVKDLLDVVLDLASAFLDLLTPQTDTFRKKGDKATDTVNSLKDAVVGLTTALKPIIWIMQLINKLHSTWNSWLKKITKHPVGNFINNLYKMSNPIYGVIYALQKAYAWFKKLTGSKGGSSATGAAKIAYDIVKGIKIKIPGMQHGGIVNQPTLAMVGESGPEAVIPLKKGGVGNTINILVKDNTFVNMDELVDRVDKELMNKLRRNLKVVSQF